MLDEYKEDFGTGIDDLQFDTPQEDYPEPTRQAVQPRGNMRQMPVTPEVPLEQYPPSRPHYGMPAYQGVPQVQDPVNYEQPRYSGYNNNQSIGEILRSKEPRLGCLRTLVLGGISLAVIGLSFWGSFLLGQKIFMPPVKEQFMKQKVADIPDFLNPETRKIVPLPIGEALKPAEPEKIYVRSTGLKKNPSLSPLPVKKTSGTAAGTIYRVIAGTFVNKENALLTMQQLKQDGFPAFVRQTGGKYQIQVGAFANRNSAQRLLERTLSFGYEASISN